MSPLQAAQQVYTCLLEMGAERSNPVLEVLPADGPVVEQHHYPEPWLAFSGLPLRAYYHCHPQPGRIEGEHGHFHLFLQVGEQAWTHLGALSMDPQGQLRALFATNRWVTDETWRPASVLQAQALPDPASPDMSPVERWLLATLHLLHPRLVSLWRRRDARLEELGASTGVESLLENREYYLLAELPIDLLSELQAVLSPQSA